MLARDPVLGHVRVDDGPGLQEELPEQGLADLLVQSPHVHRGICEESRSTKSKPPEPEAPSPSALNPGSGSPAPLFSFRKPQPTMDPELRRRRLPVSPGSSKSPPVPCRVSRIHQGLPIPSEPSTAPHNAPSVARVSTGPPWYTPQRSPYLSPVAPDTPPATPPVPPDTAAAPTLVPLRNRPRRHLIPLPLRARGAARTAARTTHVTSTRKPRVRETGRK